MTENNEEQHIEKNESVYKKKSDKVKDICEKRWEKQSRIDPCGACPLMRPCVLDGVIVPGLEAFNKWIDGINFAADNIESMKEFHD